MSDVSQETLPLCVDLDGTLLNTDSLVESAILLAKKNPLYIFSMIVWLFRGKANLKEQIASRVAPDVSLLPYNEPFLGWLRQQHAGGRTLILATASNIRVAEAVADHLPLFSQVIGSTTDRNLSAQAKCDELVLRFGDKRFDYAGNSADDLPVWRHCAKAILVNTSDDVAAQAADCAEIERNFGSTQDPVRALFRAMRPHQWSKNVLVFVSILMSHQYIDYALLSSTLVAFLSFCLCSSSVYLINDLLDLEADRCHSEKHRRPFASGEAPLLLGIAVTPVLLLLSAILAWTVGATFFQVLAMYFGVTLGYSFFFKRIAMLDVLVLASLYTLRIVAGAAAAGAMPSVWLVSFSMFLFTSLAMVKRYTELKAIEADSGAWAGGRGYHIDDLNIISQVGVVSGFISTLVLALYIDSPDVVALYSNQYVMWLLCPLMMFWIGRIWLIASRGELQQDPVIFATRDRASYIVVLIGLAILMAAL